MAQGYFAKGFFKEDFWNDDYWAAPASDTGAYWAPSFWADDFWNDNFWSLGSTSAGDVFQQAAAELSLTPQVPTVNVGLNAEPDTEALTLTPFQADANLDIDPAITVASLGLTPYAASVVVGGYQAADIDLRWVPDSTITVTYGVVASTPAIPIGPMSHTIEETGGVNVAAAVASLSLNTLVTNARLDIAVEPLPPSLTLTGFDVTAGIGQQIPAAAAALSFGQPTHNVVATSGVADARPDPAVLGLTAFEVTVRARDILIIPPSTYVPDVIVNADAEEYPSNYEICDRTGFKLRRGELVAEWTGLKVRPESWERRNVQDFVRGVGDDQVGSPRPEQADRFVYDEYPDGVTADDL